MLTPKQSMVEINKILKEVLDIPSNSSVGYLQVAINNCIRCILVADEIIQKEPSCEIAIEYLSICEKVVKKLRNECEVPYLATMIEQKALLVGKTVTKINNPN